jgi:hypothetical protein
MGCRRPPGEGPAQETIGDVTDRQLAWSLRAGLAAPFVVALVVLATKHWSPVLDLAMTEFRVRDVATAQDRPDHLKWIKFSGASWTKDGAGFFYSRYPEPADKALTDVNRREFWLLAAVAVLVFWMGLWPKPFIDVMHNSVADLLVHVAKTKL